MNATSIKDADISLCVLPLPEILNTSGEEINIPQSVRPLITKDTYFLLNKSDLVSPNPDTIRTLNQSLAELCDSQTVDRTWTASITTGAGTHTFVEGLARGLKAQYDIGDFSSSQRNLHAPIITRTRHRTHLESACSFLEAFLALRACFIYAFNAFLNVLYSAGRYCVRRRGTAVCCTGHWASNGRHRGGRCVRFCV